MKSPLRWERFRELLGALRRRRMRLIPDRRSHSEFQGIWGFGPPVDICEDNDSLTLTMEIPGLNEKDLDRKSTRLNSSHGYISYAVFCLKKKKHRQEHGSRALPTTVH